jgi:hypothetical protein
VVRIRSIELCSNTHEVNREMRIRGTSYKEEDALSSILSQTKTYPQGHTTAWRAGNHRRRGRPREAAHVRRAGCPRRNHMRDHDPMPARMHGCGGITRNRHVIHAVMIVDAARTQITVVKCSQLRLHGACEAHRASDGVVTSTRRAQGRGHISIWVHVGKAGSLHASINIIIGQDRRLMPG